MSAAQGAVGQHRSFCPLDPGKRVVMSFGDLPKQVVSTLASDPDLGGLVQMYVAEMPERIATLAASFDPNHWDALRTQAHQIKGAAGSYGFEILSALAAELELACRQADSEAGIQQAYERLLEAMRRVVVSP